jgi:hypothetical protein
MIDWWPRRSGHLRALLQVLRMARAANSMLCLQVLHMARSGH